MSEHSLERLEQMRRQIIFDAQGALSRAELQRLRQYYGDLTQIIELVTVETVQRKGGNGPLTTASLTERGEHVLARATA